MDQDEVHYILRMNIKQDQQKHRFWIGQSKYLEDIFEVKKKISDVTNPSTMEAIHSGSWVKPRGIFMAIMGRLHRHYNWLPQFCFISDDSLCVLK